MEKDRTVIIRDAFIRLYDDLHKDLSLFLEYDKIEPIPGSDEKKTRRQRGSKFFGYKWRPTGTTNSFLLLQITDSELVEIESDKDFANTFLKKAKELVVLEANDYKSDTKGFKFLINQDWYDDSTGFNSATIDLLNSFASDKLGRGPYIKDEEERILKTIVSSPRVTGGGSKVKTVPTPLDDTVINDNTKKPLNLILYGPPGTGKTYHTVNKALAILTGKDWSSAKREDAIKEFNRFKDIEKRIVFTTFHQSMSYEDFIEGIKPNLVGSSIGYKIDAGLFKQISDQASADSQKSYVLIIDEINRGNVANIFGELITLIEDDKRTTKLDKDGSYKDNPEGIRVKLPYSKDSEEDFGVPGNLYIIGTMNTADRSVEALDSALRRRFSFEEMMPVPELLESVTIDGTKITLAVLLRTINDRIEILKDREHQIGHSYFMEFVKKDNAGNVVKSTVSPDNLKTVFTDKIIPLLQEYFYGDYEKIQLVVGKGFVKEENNKPHFAVKNIEVDIPEKRFSIIDPDMKDALEKLFNPKDAAE